MGERKLRAAVLEGAYGFLRVHVLVAHEPAGFVGADRQDRETQRAEPLPGATEMRTFAVT